MGWHDSHTHTPSTMQCWSELGALCMRSKDFANPATLPAHIYQSFLPVEICRCFYSVFTINIYYTDNESPAESTLMSTMDRTVKLLLAIWRVPSPLTGFPDSGMKTCLGIHARMCVFGGYMHVRVQVHAGVASEVFTLGCQCCMWRLPRLTFTPPLTNHVLCHPTWVWRKLGTFSK